MMADMIDERAPRTKATRARASAIAGPLVLALALLGACGRPSGPGAEFAAAQAALAATLERTHDPSYKHPDFEAVAALFDAVPADAPERGSAQAMIDQIRGARAAPASPRLEAEARGREGVADGITHAESLAGGHAIHQFQNVKAKIAAQNEATKARVIP